MPRNIPSISTLAEEDIEMNALSDDNVRYRNGESNLNEEITPNTNSTLSTHSNSELEIEMDVWQFFLIIIYFKKFNFFFNIFWIIFYSKKNLVSRPTSMEINQTEEIPKRKQKMFEFPSRHSLSYLKWWKFFLINILI